MRRVRVVANRLPVTWSSESGWRSAPGGLATALASGADRERVEWVGSRATLGADFEFEPTWANGSLRLVDVDSDIVGDAIGGMTNRVLWPALHGMNQHVRWRDGYWDAYRAYNSKFASQIVATSRPDDVVWFHDYHLLLAPALVKLVRPDLTVGLSLHTPFDAESIKRLPVGDELAVVLGRADLVGAQTIRDQHAVAAFTTGTDHCAGHRVVVSPVSIDPAAVRSVAARLATKALIDERRPRFGDGRLIVGVDRLDYTKAIAERLVAYDIAFDRGVLDPDEVRIVQIAQPSRTTVREYQALRVEVERLARQVRSRWLRSDGTPAIDVYVESFDRDEVLAWLAAADIAVVTPVRDGMNLVAKEFSVVAADRDAVLVLSRGAGAVDELGDGSVLVDGANPDSVADGLAIAVRLDPHQRRAMATQRASAIEAWTAHDWSAAFINQLQTVPASGSVVIGNTLR